MKIMFLSDIHGDAEALKGAVELFDQEGADYIAQAEFPEILRALQRR